MIEENENRSQKSTAMMSTHAETWNSIPFPFLIPRQPSLFQEVGCPKVPVPGLFIVGNGLDVCESRRV